MTGARSPRLPGWPALFTISDVEFEAIWREHRDALTAEAKAAGFVPVAASWFTGRQAANSDRGQNLRAIDHVPADKNAAREKWSRQFCADHGY